jgi:hypothetical protein
MYLSTETSESRGGEFANFIVRPCTLCLLSYTSTPVHKPMINSLLYGKYRILKHIEISVIGKLLYSVKTLIMKLHDNMNTTPRGKECANAFLWVKKTVQSSTYCFYWTQHRKTFLLLDHDIHSSWKMCLFTREICCLEANRIVCSQKAFYVVLAFFWIFIIQKICSTWQLYVVKIFMSCIGYLFLTRNWL